MKQEKTITLEQLKMMAFLFTSAMRDINPQCEFVKNIDDFIEHIENYLNAVEN